MSVAAGCDPDHIHVVAEVITTDGEHAAGHGVGGKAGQTGRCRTGVVGQTAAGEADSDDECTPHARTVVVGVDGSAQSYHAFHWYITNAHIDGNYVILVHAFELPFLHSFQEMYVSPQMWDATLKREATHTTNMQKRLCGVLNRCKIPGRFEARSGRPGEVLVAVAEETDADVVIVGTRGHGRLRRALVGSVSGHVTSHAPCTVMVCRQKGHLQSDSSGSRTRGGSGGRQRQDSTDSHNSKVRFDMSNNQPVPGRRQRHHSAGSMVSGEENSEKKAPEKLYKSILSRRRNKSECDADTDGAEVACGSEESTSQKATATETEQAKEL